MFGYFVSSVLHARNVGHLLLMTESTDAHLLVSLYDSSHAIRTGLP